MVINTIIASFMFLWAEPVGGKDYTDYFWLSTSLPSNCSNNTDYFYKFDNTLEITGYLSYYETYPEGVSCSISSIKVNTTIYRLDSYDNWEYYRAYTGNYIGVLPSYSYDATLVLLDTLNVSTYFDDIYFKADISFMDYEANNVTYNVLSFTAESSFNDDNEIVNQFNWFENVEGQFAYRIKGQLYGSLQSQITSSYQDGYVKGFNDASSANSTAITIFNGIINIGLIPINFFLAIFNFEVFGINISSFVSAILSICLVIIVIRFVTGKKQEGS